MGGEVCYQKGKERGPWYEIASIRDVIISKELKEQNVSFERSLLKSWSKYKGYEGAKEALESIPRTNKKSKNKGV